MSFLSVLLLFFFTSLKASPDWSGISSCGDYQVRGIARSGQHGLVIVVNEKSQSEFTIRVPINNEAKLAPYLNKALNATVNFEKKWQGSNYLGVVKEIGPRIPNPLSPKDSGVKILIETKCLK